MSLMDSNANGMGAADLLVDLEKENHHGRVYV